MSQFRGAVDLTALSSTPSAPSSGYVRLYTKTDGRVYTQDSSSVESVTGSGNFGPLDHGLFSWSYDFSITTSGQALTAGTIYLVGQQVCKSGNATKIYWVNQGAATSLTSAQCWAALLDSSGTVLASVDVSGNGGGGTQTATISSTAVTPGFYWIGFVFNGTTPPSLARNSTISAAALNINRTVSQARFATNGTSQTTITNRTPASNTNLAAALWAALG